MNVETSNSRTVTYPNPVSPKDECTCHPLCHCDAGKPTTRAEMLSVCHSYIATNEQKLPLLLADKRTRKIAEGIKRNVQISRMYIAREQLTDAIRAERMTI